MLTRRALLTGLVALLSGGCLTPARGEAWRVTWQRGRNSDILRTRILDIGHGGDCRLCWGFPGPWPSLTDRDHFSQNVIYGFDDSGYAKNGIAILCRPCHAMLTLSERVLVYRTFVLVFWGENGPRRWPLIERALRREMLTA